MNNAAFNLMLSALKAVWASHLLAVRMHQPGLGALLSHRVREAIEAGEKANNERAITHLMKQTLWIGLFVLLCFAAGTITARVTWRDRLESAENHVRLLQEKSDEQLARQLPPDSIYVNFRGLADTTRLLPVNGGK